jgi:hypothetical protein
VLDAWIEAHRLDMGGETPADDFEREMGKRNLRSSAGPRTSRGARERRP